MTLSTAGLAMLEDLESCRLQAYDDATGQPLGAGAVPQGTCTIGFGATGPDIAPGLVWTQAQADARLASDLAAVEWGVKSLLDVNLTDNQFSAFVSLAYNIGLAAFAGSSALHLANTSDPGDVPAHIALWNKTVIAGRLVVSAGLVGRRAAECALWELPDDAPVPDFCAIRDQAVANYGS